MPEFRVVVWADHFNQVLYKYALEVGRGCNGSLPTRDRQPAC